MHLICDFCLQCNLVKIGPTKLHAPAVHPMLHTHDPDRCREYSMFDGGAGALLHMYTCAISLGKYSLGELRW